MSIEQKTEVLEKIIDGKMEPYYSEHSKITITLFKNLVVGNNANFFWTGNIVNPEKGLIKVKLKALNSNNSTDVGIQYLDKDLPK